MSGNGEIDLVQDVLGSAHAFSAAVGHVVETRLLREIAGTRLTFSQLKLLRLVARIDSHSISDVTALLGVDQGGGEQDRGQARAATPATPQREGLSSFSMLASHVLVPPAIELLLRSPRNAVQG